MSEVLAKMSDGKQGMDLLRDPAVNRGDAYTMAERKALGLQGLVPPASKTINVQARRFLKQLAALKNPLHKYVLLMALQDTNETLFYKIVIDNTHELMPLIYTPVVGEACQKYGLVFQRPRGMYISIQDKGNVASIVKNWPEKDAAVCVVTDGERILGLGDLGAYGMGIPVGKLNLYSACAGIHPRQCLPLLLDVGTNNKTLLQDPLYTGLQQPRVRGKEYEDFLEEVLMTLHNSFPGMLIQFEDFGNTTAFHLLERYRNRICTFNDDIQGTASVALAGLLGAVKAKGSKLRDQTLLFMGAGEAGTGIADLVVSQMQAEGLTLEDARRRCWLVDSKGLVVADRPGKLQHHKIPYAHKQAPIRDLFSAIKELKPTALIGVSAQPKVFTEQVVQLMCRLNPRPVIFPLSNPTTLSECTAEEAFGWSHGSVLFASGSPFGPVTIKGKTYVPGQGNNAYIFPGVGLGVVAGRIKHVTEGMLRAAAHALADQVTDEDMASGCLYPPLSKIRHVSSKIAVAVLKEAQEKGLVTVDLGSDTLANVQKVMYNPVYTDLARL